MTEYVTIERKRLSKAMAYAWLAGFIAGVATMLFLYLFFA